MSRAVSLTILAFVGVGWSCAREDRGAPVSVATSLPIEVLGEPVTRVAVELDVPPSVASDPAISLELTVNNVVEENAAFLHLEGGSAVDLGAASSGLLRPFGGNASARLSLPRGAIHAGRNRVVFGYERKVRDVSGFRVLAMALVTASARVDVDLPEDDPATWAPPSNATDALALGERYFTEETRDGGPTCSTCHANDGADLAYFAFSNRSIVARAQHHLFSLEEAEAIASYIRALPVGAEGRVFEPPFQPGSGNHGAAGAGHRARLDTDTSLGDVLFPGGLPTTALAWDVAATFDAYGTPSVFETPTWLRWLPRRVDADWFTRAEGRLLTAERAMDASADIATARAFQEAAIQVGKEILIYEGDHGGRIELLRYAAVKLWAWQRARGGFETSDHGFPDGGPAFPYEVGFAFFEAAQSGVVPYAMEQAMSWWVVQLAVNPGRGLCTGDRPLNYRDVLLAAEGSSAGSNTLAYLHLIGSFEESQGSQLDRFGSDSGPVRLLAVPFRGAPPDLRAALMARFLAREGEHLAGGGTLTPAHHIVLAQAWAGGCASLSVEQRSALRAMAPAAVLADLVDCPD